MLLLDVEKELSGKRRGLKAQLRELELAAWSAGNPALFYCSVCEAAVPSKDAIEGPLENWPYCPIHAQKPLMIHAASPRLGLQ